MDRIDLPDSEFVLARAVALKGFGGRRAGELSIFGTDGKLQGSLFGGAADDEIAERASKVARSDVSSFELVTVKVGDQTAVDAGLACGGEADVLLNSRRSFPAGFLEKLSRREPVALATVVSGIHKGLVAAISSDMRLVGLSGELADDPFAQNLEAAISRAFTRRLQTAAIEEMDGEVVCLEVFSPPTHMLILGTSELAKAIVDQGRLLGWSSNVVEDLEQGLGELRDLGSNDALVILSHDHSKGVPMIAEIFGSRSSTYIGCLGSRHTQLTRLALLGELGFTQEQMQRIHGPIGLDLGSKTPEETALAICSEILAHTSGRDARSLRGSNGPING